MYKGQRITVVIPCLNEEQGIEQVLKSMPGLSDEAAFLKAMKLALQSSTQKEEVAK